MSLHAKNVIFMVSDGMSLGVPSLAEPFSKLVRQRSTAWYRLAQSREVSHGFFETASLNSLVTDSAAASSAWNSGSRVFNHFINVLPDGRHLVPIAPLAQESGRKIGVVTTATITHATPAGLLIAQADRDNEQEIALQFLKLAPHVLLGGGNRSFLSANREDKRELLADFTKAGYQCLSTRDEAFHASPHEKVLGLFETGHFPYAIDHKAQPGLVRRIPTLPEMTTMALRSLAANSPEGFLLQIEAARVDHAAHNNDPAALLWEQLAFDETIDVVLEFVRAYPDTLVIITSDHSTGNPGLNGLSASYDGSSQAFARLTRFKTSFADLRNDLMNQPRMNSNNLLQNIFAATGLELAQSDARLLLQASGLLALGNPDERQPNFIDALAAVTRNETGIGWSGTTHTSDLVPILAIGPERDRYQGLLRNSDNFGRLAPLLGITHKNPFFTEAQAAPYLTAEGLGKVVGRYV